MIGYVLFSLLLTEMAVNGKDINDIITLKPNDIQKKSKVNNPPNAPPMPPLFKTLTAKEKNAAATIKKITAIAVKIVIAIKYLTFLIILVTTTR